jgi:hypothetical protein
MTVHPYNKNTPDFNPFHGSPLNFLHFYWPGNIKNFATTLMIGMDCSSFSRWDLCKTSTFAQFLCIPGCVDIDDIVVLMPICQAKKVSPATDAPDELKRPDDHLIDRIIGRAAMLSLDCFPTVLNL